jgi:hypothetical protein
MMMMSAPNVIVVSSYVLTMMIADSRSSRSQSQLSWSRVLHCCILRGTVTQKKRSRNLYCNTILTGESGGK